MSDDLGAEVFTSDPQTEGWVVDDHLRSPATPPVEEAPRDLDAERRAYDEGRWCGECRYGVIENPPCCARPVSGDTEGLLSALRWFHAAHSAMNATRNAVMNDLADLINDWSVTEPDDDRGGDR